MSRRRLALEAIADPSNNATTNEQEIARKLLAGLTLSDAQTRGPPTHAYFCGDGMGVFGREGGHYCYTPDGARARGEAVRSPWGSRWDPLTDSPVIEAMRGFKEPMYSRRTEAEGEGFPHHRQRDGWTLVAWWDRSGDVRHGSVAAFALQGLYPPAEAEAQARALFPGIFARMDLHLGRSTAAQELREAVIRALAGAPQKDWVAVARVLQVQSPGSGD